jgi:hypothetical protein
MLKRLGIRKRVLEATLNRINNGVLRMSIKALFTINESLPFPVKYHKEDGKSVCTVSQEDLEELYSAYRRASKIVIILGVAVVVLSICFGVFAVKYKPESVVVAVPMSNK